MVSNGGVYRERCVQPGVYSYRDIYNYGRQRLKSSGPGEEYADCGREARLLLCTAAGFDAVRFFLRQNDIVDPAVAERYYSFIERRVKHEPVQYIVGEWEFMGLPFTVTRDTLIPRQDTECLAEAVIGRLRKSESKKSAAIKPTPIKQADLGQSAIEPAAVKPSTVRPFVLDLCTGSGCVAISIAAIYREVAVVGTDISLEALKAAKINACRNNVCDRVCFAHGDLYAALSPDNPDFDIPFMGGCYSGAQCLGGLNGDKPGFDVICANPPYIPSGEISSLPEDVREYEPLSALDGGIDGLDFYRRILNGTAGCQRILKRGGFLALEAGTDTQCAVVADMLREHGFRDVETLKDLTGAGRVVTGELM